MGLLLEVDLLGRMWGFVVEPELLVLFNNFLFLFLGFKAGGLRSQNK